LKKFSYVERRIIQETFKSGGSYFVFKIHHNQGISPGQISKALLLLKNKKMVATDGLRVRLTNKGKRFATSAKLLLVAAGEKPWRNCPNEFIASKLNPDEPYIPMRKQNTSSKSE